MRRWFNKLLTVAVVAFGALYIPSLLEAAIPAMEGLREQGGIVYIISGVFILGLDFVLRHQDERAGYCLDLLPTLGFLGTALGFSIYLQQWSDGNQDLAGLKLAFLTTAQGLILSVMLMLVMLGKKLQSPPTQVVVEADDGS